MVDENGVNPIQVQKFLSGINYPAEKNDIINAAKSNGADENVLRTLEKIPERTYHGPNAVSEELGRKE